jgi:imidazoleglycerol-phosphate dehydratase
MAEELAVTRKGKVSRKTGETDISLEIVLDGSGTRNIQTPVNMLNHLLDLFAKHGLFDLSVHATGDVHIDDHHTIEDIGIVLGEAFAKAIGDKKGIKRYGTCILPMDEVLALVSIDIAGRYAFAFDLPLSRDKIGDMAAETVYDFFDAFAQSAKVALHVKLITPGRNDHHRVEGAFKAFGHALRQAVEKDERAANDIPSTKGVL